MKKNTAIIEEITACLPYRITVTIYGRDGKPTRRIVDYAATLSQATWIAQCWTKEN